MTQQQFIDAFILWASAHGVVAKPENDQSWTPTPDGAVAPTQMTYAAPNLAKLRLPADVMFWQLGDTLDSADDERMAIYLRQVLAIYGLPLDIKVAWREFLHPSPKVPDAIASGPIGSEVPRESVATQATLGGRIDGNRRYFYPGTMITEGQCVEVDGKRYVAVKPGPFATWWMLIG